MNTKTNVLFLLQQRVAESGILLRWTEPNNPYSGHGLFDSERFVIHIETHSEDTFWKNVCHNYLRKTIILAHEFGHALDYAVRPWAFNAEVYGYATWMSRMDLEMTAWDKALMMLRLFEFADWNEFEAIRAHALENHFNRGTREIYKSGNLR